MRPAETLEGGDVTLTITRGYDTDGGCKGLAERLLYNFEAGTEGTELFVDFVTEPVGAEHAVAQFLEVITWRFEDPPNVDAGSATTTPNPLLRRPSHRNWQAGSCHGVSPIHASMLGRPSAPVGGTATQLTTCPSDIRRA